MEGKSLTDVIWVVVCAGFVFLMQPGFLCLESGLTRAKNSINVAIKNLSDLGVSVLVFWAWGFAWMFGPSIYGLIGSEDYCPSPGRAGAYHAAFFLFQAVFCGTATTIFSGAVAERMRFSGYLVTAAVISGIVYPIFGHWAWNSEGWIRELGFVDFAGSTVVHVVGGMSALACVIFIGPRLGRFPPNGPPREIIGHNQPLAILGTLLLWFGWFGFNGGSTLAMDDRVPAILANTMLAGIGGLMTGMLLGWWLVGRPAVPHLINGALAGLVAVTASCDSVSAGSALAIGSIGGVVMLIAERWLLKLRIDDVVGAVPVHAAAGIWGTLAVALFADPQILNTGLSTSRQLLSQATGVGVAAAWSLGLTFLALWILRKFSPVRVSPDVEHLGLNIAEHGATTELVDLFHAMDRQAHSGNLSIRMPVEPFTEVGQIAERYNHVMDALEAATGQLRVSHSRLVRDLQAASTVQRSLLPARSPMVSGAKFSWHYQPCDELAGDILNIIPLDERHVGVYVADVSGKGVAAALLSVAVSRILVPQAGGASLLVRPNGRGGHDIVPPAEVAAELNRRFPMEEFGDRYFTIVYGVLDLQTRVFRYVSAGHPPIVRCNHRGESSLCEADGLPIGWMANVEYEERVIHLEPGERLVLLSDGIPEAMSPDRQPFGETRILTTAMDHCARTLDDLVAGLLSAVEGWSGSAGQRDDISVVSLEISPVA